ncbi:MAG: glycosyltransferase family 1 protein [Pseudomonas sp.]|uniref:glycosyltransferase family 4 protein n=1 Tax=Pseudomonas sp. TaxID=306 RepID=UPI003390BBE9
MHLVDMTLFYTPASGGVRTYLEAKHRLIGAVAGVRHSLLVPGAAWAQSDARYQLPAARLPFCRDYRMPLRAAPWLKLLDGLQPDLIEAGDPYRTAWIALQAGRRLDIPVIGFYHSDLPRLVGNRIGPWLGEPMKGYVRRLYGRFDRVLVPSAVMAERLVDLGIAQVHLQPLGVDLATFRPGRRDPALKRVLGLSEGCRLMLFAGRGSREKNLPQLLEAARLLGPPYQLLLVGSGMPTRTPANVRVIDRFCPADEVACLMASCDLLLHAGAQETFGLVVLEAMACGLPVVAVRAGALAELVPFHCGRLCRPADPAAMAAAVREVFDGDPRQLGRQARLHVEAHYGWEQVVDGLLGHYRAVLGQAQPVEWAHG